MTVTTEAVVGGYGGSLLDRERIIAKPGFNRWLVPPAALAIHRCIGMASPMLQEIFAGSLIGRPYLTFSQLDTAQKGQLAAIAAGLTGLLSLFNIGGRFFWASLSDKIGRCSGSRTLYRHDVHPCRHACSRPGRQCAHPAASAKMVHVGGRSRGMTSQDRSSSCRANRLLRHREGRSYRTGPACMGSRRDSVAVGRVGNAQEQCGALRLRTPAT